MILWILKNWDGIIWGYMGIIGLASVIVKLTPTLSDDHALLPIIKFLGKYVALNKTVKQGERPLL